MFLQDITSRNPLPAQGKDIWGCHRLWGKAGVLVPSGVFRGGAAFPLCPMKCRSHTKGTSCSLGTSLAVSCAHDLINVRNEEREVT